MGPDSHDEYCEGSSRGRIVLGEWGHLEVRGTNTRRQTLNHGLENGNSDQGIQHFNQVVLSSLLTILCVRYQTLPETTFYSYVILDDDHLLLVFICPAANAPKISVINFRNPEHSKISFLFPEISQEHDAYHLHLSGGSTPSAIPNRPTFPPFITATTDKIITLSVFTDSSDRFLFVLPSWVLKQEVERVRRDVDLSTQEEIVVPWHLWGPRGTAFFPTIPRTFIRAENASISTSGAIQMTVEDRYIVLRDFNRYALRRDVTLGHEDTSAITSGSNEVHCDLFKHPFSACLPWRKFKTELRLERDLPVAFMHEAIIVLHESQVRMSPTECLIMPSNPSTAAPGRGIPGNNNVLRQRGRYYSSLL